jgi:hypothetical protein
VPGRPNFNVTTVAANASGNVIANLYSRECWVVDTDACPSKRGSSEYHTCESGHRRQRVDRTKVTNLIKRTYFIRHSL